MYGVKRQDIEGEWRLQAYSSGKGKEVTFFDKSGLNLPWSKIDEDSWKYNIPSSARGWGFGGDEGGGTVVSEEGTQWIGRKRTVKIDEDRAGERGGGRGGGGGANRIRKLELEL